LCFITNDRKLGEDLCREYKTDSVKTHNSMAVIKVSKRGEPTFTCLYLNGKPIMIKYYRRWYGKNKPKLSMLNIVKTRDIKRHPLKVGHIPQEGDTVYCSNGKEYHLIEYLGGGGEGDIYATNDPKLVAKIYHRDKITRDIYEKVRVMVENKDKIESGDGFLIAWPEEVLYNSEEEFVGFLMTKAEGEPLQYTIFQPKLLQEKFPHFTRSHLVYITINVLKAFYYLHNVGVLMGDINPLNILVNDDCTVTFIDTDSYQLGPFRCKVGRPEFTYPERIGLKYEDYDREPKDEMFGMATLTFMILLLGKHPFSHEGGEDIIDNIRQRKFPYRVSKYEETSYEDAPLGRWKYIWSHTPLMIKKFLYEVFTGKKEPENFEEMQKMTSRLIGMLERYADQIKGGKRTNELFPRYNYIPDHIPKVSLKCSECGSYFEINEEYYNKIRYKDEILCPYCFMKRRISMQLTSSPIIRDTASVRQTKKRDNSSLESQILILLILMILLFINPGLFLLMLFILVVFYVSRFF